MDVLRALGTGSLAALLAVWFGYPLVMRIIGAVRGAPPARPLAAWPTVTAVIATRDPPEAIGARVANLLETAYQPGRFDVVVAVDHAAAPLATALELSGPVRVVVGDPPGGKAPGLNAGVRAATGEILVFSDTFQRFDPDTIAELVSAFADPRVGAASGALYLPSGGSGLLGLYWTMERRLRRDEARVHSVIGVTGAVYAMRRALWQPLPDGLILDDVYGPMRLVLAGHRIAFVDTARATDHRVTTADQEYRRKVRTLAGNVQLCAWLPAVLDPRANPVWAQFFLHKLARLITPWWLLLIAIWLLAEIVRATPGRLVWGSMAALLVASVWILLGSGQIAGRIRSLVVWIVSLQAAVVRGTYLGVRGRWDVWQR
jgi:cellulose synthase/poly-beta-1,6-N-acetylglucosamine synthase-like glycosyltransferase